MRRKNEEGKSIYCLTHQAKLKTHKESHPCGIKCAKIRELQKQVRKCDDCQKPHLFDKQIRKQIKCERVVDLLIIKEAENKENLLLLLIKKDNSCEKRSLVGVKN